jgi:hypothetical protein
MENLKIDTGKHSRDILFYLLKDYDYTNSLAREVFPNHKKNEKSTTISEVVNTLGLFDYCDKKKLRMRPSFRATRNGTMTKPKMTPYHPKKKIEQYRMTIKSLFDMGQLKWNVTERTKNILEILFYPKVIRELCFYRKRFELHNKSINNLMVDFLQEVLIYNMSLSTGSSFIANYDMFDEYKPEFNFNEYMTDKGRFKKGYTADSVAKLLLLDFKKCAWSEETSLMVYLSYFLDKEFFADIILAISNKTFIKLYSDNTVGNFTSMKKKYPKYYDFCKYIYDKINDSAYKDGSEWGSDLYEEGF